MNRWRRRFCIGGVVVLLWLSCVFAAAQPLLKQGMEGEDVRQMQLRLQEFGYLDTAVSGLFDEPTWRSLIHFQIDNGLDADGICGEQTRAALREGKTIAGSRGLPGSRRAAEIAAMARGFLGVPYAWAGASPNGFDCSGFVYYLYLKAGVQLPRMADGQFAVGTPVSRAELQPGDLVFFSTYEPGPSHSGIYAGNNLFVHASSGAGEVTITSLAKPYYAERYLGARRILR
ncbi:MAG: NlpC/P60 family protein [Sporomusaceae bacterium]|nr:NlpC/P60 family protein [Sporomusaceae bacterium]